MLCRKADIGAAFLTALKILVVEDEPLLLMVSSEYLRDVGFDVLEAKTVDEAAALLEDMAKDVVAVFSDVETPGRMNGLHLAEKMAESWPHLPLLLTSGRVFPTPNTTTASVHFISKPYKLRHICSLIADLVESPGSARPPYDAPT